MTDATTIQVNPMTDIPIVELRNCPFCGDAEPVVVPPPPLPGGFHGLIDQRPYYVHCESCGADGPGCDTPVEAIAAWNTRAPDPALKECVETLERAARTLNWIAMITSEGSAVRLRAEAEIGAIGATLAAMTKGEE